jgi:hypothetical protein
MSVVPLRQRRRCLVPMQERFYMRWTAQEVNQIDLMIDPCVEKSFSRAGQSLSYSESRTNQKLNSDWRLGSSVRTVGN